MSTRSEQVPTVSHVSRDIPGLGHITGLSYNDGECEQFLGIPYGEVPARFRRPVPAPEPWPDNKWDGTKLGPICPQPPRDLYPVPDPPRRTWLNHTPPADEFKCLNLNISVPRHAPGAKLPVMVWLHGGAFTYASGSAAIYDGRLLATASATDPDIARPTILITVTYRLGAFGFLAGTDIQAANSDVDGGASGNYGLWDQVLALRWVRAHAAAFGGDAERVTLFGQSAGAVSAHAHLLRGEPLFAAALLQSGHARLCGVMAPAAHQRVFERVLREAAGVSALPLAPAEERVAALRRVDAGALNAAMARVAGIAVVTMALCDDGVFLGAGKRFPGYEAYGTALALPPWCTRVALGDAASECIIWNKAWRHTTAAQLRRALEQHFGAEDAGAVARLYGITGEMGPRETFDAIERLTSDAMYRIPAFYAERCAAASQSSSSANEAGGGSAGNVGNGGKTEVYAWHFDVPSPFDNEWGGLAHHSLDNVLVWGILEHALPPTAARVGRLMRRAWIRFANGEAPWEPFEAGNEKWMVFGCAEGEVGMRDKQEDAARGYDIWEELDRRGLIAELAVFADELCIRRKELTAPV